MKQAATALQPKSNELKGEATNSAYSSTAKHDKRG